MLRQISRVWRTSNTRSLQLLPSSAAYGKPFFSTKNYDEEYKRSIQHPESFWAEAAQNVSWFKPWTNTLNRYYDLYIL